MKIRSLYLISALLLVIILLTSMMGCSGGGSNVKGITVQNVGEKVRTALQSLHSYEADMEMAANVEGVVEGQTMALKMSAKANGAMDLEAKKSGTEMAISVTGKAGTEKVDQTTKTSTYIIEDTAYVGTADESGKMTWKTQSAPSSTWDQQQQTQQMMSLLDSSNIKYLKSEKVQSTQCYLVELDPDLNLLWNFIMQQMGSSSPDMDTSQLSNAIKEATVKYWFDQDTLFFRKVYVYIDMEMDAEMLGAKSGSVKYIIELTSDFNKYNTNMNIQLPAEATED